MNNLRCLFQDYAKHNPDWQRPFGATRNSHITNVTDVTYDLFSSAVTLIFYGSNLVPVKRIGSGDGRSCR